MYIIALTVFNSFLFSLILLFEKILLGRMNNYTFFCIKSFLIFAFTIALMMYRKDTLDEMKVIDRTSWIYITIVISITIINLLLWYYIMTHDEIHRLAAIKYPVALAMLALMGYFIQGKDMRWQEVVGIILVIIGVIMINGNKNISSNRE